MNDKCECQTKKERKPKGTGKRSKNDRAVQIGERIKQERKANGFKDQLSLATEMYVAQNTISSWETGAVVPSMEQLIRLAKLFHCDVAYLLCDYDDRNITDKWITEQIGLTSDAIQWLRIAKTNSPEKIAILNILFQNDLIAPLLNSMYLYSCSQYQTLKVSDALTEHERSYDLTDSRNMLKYDAQEMLSMILDHLYSIVSESTRKAAEIKIAVMKKELENLEHKMERNDTNGKH